MRNCIKHGENDTKNYKTGKIKKSVFSILSAALALFFVFLYIYHQNSASGEKENDRWTKLAIDFRELSFSENAENALSIIERIRNDLYYTNAESVAKYKMSRILSYVENNFYDNKSKDILSDVKNIFTYGRVRDKNSFFAVCEKIYDSYCAEDAAPRGENLKNPESSYGKEDERTPRAENKISEKAILKLFCNNIKSIEIRKTVSDDGRIWAYTKNIFSVLSPDGAPSAMLVSPRGSSRLVFEKKFSSGGFFDRKCDVSFISESADGMFETVRIFDAAFPDNFVLCEKMMINKFKNEHSDREMTDYNMRFVYFDFSSFTFASSDNSDKHAK